MRAHLKRREGRVALWIGTAREFRCVSVRHLQGIVALLGAVGVCMRT